MQGSALSIKFIPMHLPNETHYIKFAIGSIMIFSTQQKDLRDRIEKLMPHIHIQMKNSNISGIYNREHKI